MSNLRIILSVLAYFLIALTIFATYMFGTLDDGDYLEFFGYIMIFGYGSIVALYIVKEVIRIGKK